MGLCNIILRNVWFVEADILGRLTNAREISRKTSSLTRYRSTHDLAAHWCTWRTDKLMSRKYPQIMSKTWRHVEMSVTNKIF